MRIPGLLRPSLTRLSGQPLRRLRMLNPFLRGAFDRLWKLPRIYSVLHSAAVGISRSDFFNYAKSYQRHYERATQFRDWDLDRPILISLLPQEKSILENRFWARIMVIADDLKGHSVNLPYTIGFDKKLSQREIIDSRWDDITESLETRGLALRTIRVSEIYKQW